MWPLLTILVLAAGLRVALLVGRLTFGPPVTGVGDEWNYHERACNLVYHGVYSASDGPPYLPDAIRPPGLPAVLALVYATVGPNPAAPLFLINLANIATVGVVAWMASRLWSRQIGLWAGLFLALDVNHALSGTDLLTETFGALGALVATWALIVGLRRTRHAWILASGVLWGLTALTRPTFVWVAAPLAIAAAARYWPRWGLMARATAVLLAGMLLVVGPWLVRNHLVCGSPSLCLEIGETMYEWNGAILVARLTGQTPAQAREQLRLRLARYLGDEEQCQAHNDRVMRLEALKLFTAHPLAVAGLQAEGVAKFFVALNRDRLARILPEGGVWSRLWISAALLWYITMALAVPGVRQLWLRERAVALFVILLVVYAATLASMQGQGRFRVPVDPLICLLAGFGAAWAWEGLQRRFRRPAAAAGPPPAT